VVIVDTCLQEQQSAAGEILVRLFNIPPSVPRFFWNLSRRAPDTSSSTMAQVLSTKEEARLLLPGRHPIFTSAALSLLDARTGSDS
jgi:hypothetical protein